MNITIANIKAFIKKQKRILTLVAILILTLVGFGIYSTIFKTESNTALELINRKYTTKNPYFGFTFKKTSMIKINNKSIDSINVPKYVYLIKDINGVTGGYIINYQRILPLFKLTIQDNVDAVKTFQVIDKSKQFDDLVKLITDESFVSKNDKIFKLEEEDSKLTQEERVKIFQTEDYFEGPRNRGSGFGTLLDYDQIDDFKRLKKGDDLFKIQEVHKIGADLGTPGLDRDDGFTEAQAMQKDNPELPRLRFVSMFYKNFDGSSVEGSKSSILEKFAAITYDKQIIYAEVLSDGSFDIEGLKVKLK